MYVYTWFDIFWKLWLNNIWFIRFQVFYSVYYSVQMINSQPKKKVYDRLNEEQMIQEIAIHGAVI